MGNEQSETPAVDISDKAVEVRDFWSHHSGSITKNEECSKLSVFIGDLFVDGALWVHESPLQKMGKNLMIYRHPCIIKYYSTWQKPSKCYLATEESTPLSLIVGNLSTLEICVGLHSILKALCFLHDKAGVSHNNVNLNSIYVTNDCSWKLGAMQFCCKYKDLTVDYLSKAKKCGSCAEGFNFQECVKIFDKRKDILDVYGFASLAVKLLSTKTDENNLTVSTFKEYCKEILNTVDATQRPSLSAILNHDFFNNNFLKIHSFLIELPLNTDEQKNEFFLSLYDELKNFDSELIATHLGNLILSRLVFLDKTAQTHLLPQVLFLKTQDDSGGLFSSSVFRKHISPKIIKIISVRDIQIRLILLKHFSSFVSTFTKDELQTYILPELLLGIKDTNSELVAATLRVLADLVPILGPEIVIGGQRAKLFNDGRPVSHESVKSQSLRFPQRSVSNNSGIVTNIALDSRILSTNSDLPERPSPDGEEGETSGTEEVDLLDNEDLDNWEDWSNDNVGGSGVVECTPEIEGYLEENVPNEQPLKPPEINKISIIEESSSKSHVTTKPIVDIKQLDIKNQSASGDDVDFFQDMEPVIETKAKYVIEKISTNQDSGVCDKLTLTGGEEQEDGWIDEDWS